MALLTWNHSQGLESLARMYIQVMKKSLAGLKSGVKRRQNNLARLEIRNTPNTVERLRIERQKVKTFRRAVKSAKPIGDSQAIEVASRAFSSIKVGGGVVAGYCSEGVTLTHQGAKFKTRPFVVVLNLKSTPARNRMQTEEHNITIRELDDGDGTPTVLPRKLHPHVSDSGIVCFGNWERLMKNLIREKRFWPRTLAFCYEFLGHYTPEGGPFSRIGKMAHEGQINQLEGPEICADCDQAECRCETSRDSHSVVCPSTLASIPTRPEPQGYCYGCRYLRASQPLGTQACSFPVPSPYMNTFEAHQPPMGGSLYTALIIPLYRRHDGEPIIPRSGDNDRGPAVVTLNADPYGDERTGTQSLEQYIHHFIRNHSDLWEWGEPRELVGEHTPNMTPRLIYHLHSEGIYVQMVIHMRFLDQPILSRRSLTRQERAVYAALSAQQHARRQSVEARANAETEERMGRVEDNVLLRSYGAGTRIHHNAAQTNRQEEDNA